MISFPLAPIIGCENSCCFLNMQNGQWSLNSLLIKHSLISLNHCASVVQIFCKFHERLFIFVLIVSLHPVILKVTLLLTFPAPKVCVPAKLFYFSLQECFESIWKYLKVFIQRSAAKNNSQFLFYWKYLFCFLWPEKYFYFLQNPRQAVLLWGPACQFIVLLSPYLCWKSQLSA